MCDSYVVVVDGETSRGEWCCGVVKKEDERRRLWTKSFRLNTPKNHCRGTILVEILLSGSIVRSSEWTERCRATGHGKGVGASLLPLENILRERCLGDLRTKVRRAEIVCSAASRMTEWLLFVCRGG